MHDHHYSDPMSLSLYRCLLSGGFDLKIHERRMRYIRRPPLAISRFGFVQALGASEGFRLIDYRLGRKIYPRLPPTEPPCPSPSFCERRLCHFEDYRIRLSVSEPRS